MSELNEKLDLKQVVAAVIASVGMERTVKIGRCLTDEEMELLTLEVAKFGETKETINEILANFIRYVFRTT